MPAGRGPSLRPRFRAHRAPAGPLLPAVPPPAGRAGLVARQILSPESSNDTAVPTKRCGGLTKRPTTPLPQQESPFLPSPPPGSRRSSYRVRSPLRAFAAEHYYVRHLPGLADPQGIKQFAGHITVDPAKNGNLFFWLVLHHHNINTDKLIIWLNGGPGCSSMDGLFLEVGAYRVQFQPAGNLTLEINQYSWHHQANVLFVDQPYETGFSYANDVAVTHAEVTKRFLTFLDEFFTTFPQFATDEVFLTGESYAGIFIPNIALALLTQNKERTTKINLRGIAIGNGWMDPETQFRSYIHFASTRGLLSDEHLETAKGHLQSCEASFAGNNTAPLGKQAHACDEILGAVLAQSTANNGRNNCVNYYDIRLADNSCGQQWPAPLEHVTAYLNQPEVVNAVNAGGKVGGWKECAGSVDRGLEPESSISSYQLFPEILAEIPVLLFAGDQDLICNYEGIEQMISRISWNGGTGFANEDRELLWKVGPAGGTAEPAGTYRTARNLTYVKIFNASHMVAWDKPAEAMDMIHRFVGLGGGVGVQSWIEGEPDVPASPTGPPLTEIPPDAAEKSATVPWALLSFAFLVLASLCVACFVVTKRRKGWTWRNLFAKRDPYAEINNELDVWSQEIRFSIDE